MQIDHRQVPPQTLVRIIESFVQREGTDYGDREHSLQDKVAQVRRQLDQKQVVLVFDQETETVNIITQEALKELTLL